MNGHTPGKWIKNLNRIETESGEEIARASYRMSGHVQANTTLIAAAPELLGACQAAYRAIVLGNGGEIDWDVVADQLRAAIAAAEAEGVNHDKS